jgi:seryl-tRNA synthetase
VHDALVRHDARQRFNTLVKKNKELETKFNELEAKKNAVSKELEESVMLRERADEEREEAIAHLMIVKDKERITMDARNEMAYQLLQSGNHQRSAPIMEAVATTSRA